MVSGRTMTMLGLAMIAAFASVAECFHEPSNGAFPVIIDPNDYVKSSCTSKGGCDLEPIATECSMGNSCFFSDGDFDYNLSICSGESCGGVTTSFSKVNDDEGTCQSLMQWDSSGKWSNLSNGDLQVVFNNGYKCESSGAPVQTTIIFECDPNANDQSKMKSVTSKGCNYDVVMKTHTTCKCPKTESGGHGLSLGSLLLLVFFVSFLVYLIFGTIYKNKVQGVEGIKESIPNIDFWLDLPGLVKDGTVFFVEKCKNGFGKRSGYEEMPDC